MRSMTGFGKGIAEKEKRKITVEIKTVNHKQLDLSVKTPRTMAYCENAIRCICKKYLTRGHIDVFVNYNDNREDKGEVNIDVSLAKQYFLAGAELEKIGITNDLSVSNVLRLPDVISIQENEDDEAVVTQLAVEATESACLSLVAMREREGEALKQELLFRLKNLQKIVEEIEFRAPIVSENYAKKLRMRLEEVLNGINIDESKFLTEIACFVDKSNIDEEITRLKTHIKQGFALMQENGDIGKKLDFLVQEKNREINTIGSKSNDIALTQKVLLAKNELEKFREQVQNIE